MRKLNRYFVITFVALLFLSGCKNTSSTTVKSNSNSTNTQTSQSGSGSSSSVNAPSFNPVGPITPVKSTAIAVSGSILYYRNWSDNDKLYKINTNGTGKQKLIDDKVSEFIVTDSTIYYSNKSDYFKLYSANLDGTGKQRLLDEKASNLILMDNYIYFIDSSSSIAAIDITSKVKTPLNKISRYFDTDGTKIYFESFEGDKLSLKSVNIDDTNITKINDDEPLGIVAGQSVLYYVNALDGGKIYKGAFDGSGRVKLNDFNSSNIQVDNSWIYYLNHDDFQKLYKMKLDGTGNIKLSDEDFIKAYTIAGNFVYFDITTDMDHSIYKVNK